MSIDNAIHQIARALTCDGFVWRETCIPWIKSYYAEDSLYLLKDTRFNHPSLAVVFAKSPDDAAKWQVEHGGWRAQGATDRGETGEPVNADTEARKEAKGADE